MWDIKLQATSEQTRQPNKNSYIQTPVWWLLEEKGGWWVVKGKGGQTRGDRRRFDSGWWAHKAVYG